MPLVGLVVVRALGDAHGDPGDDRLLRALVEALAAPLDRGQELVQVDLERREDRVGPVLHLEARLARLAAGVVDDLAGLALRELDDLGLGGLANRLLAGLTEDPVTLALGLGQHLLALLDDPAGLLDLLGNRRPHLVEDVVDLLAVDPNLVGQRDGLRVVDEVVELVDQDKYIHRFSESTEGFGLRPSSPETALRRLRFWLRLRRRLSCLGGAENPAPAAGSELLQQLLGIAAREHDLVVVSELLLEPVCRLAPGPARPELLQDLVGVALREADLAAGCEQGFEVDAHSWGFSGVPGRPSGKSSLNL